jgi:protein arginine N-methyltransferase 7
MNVPTPLVEAVNDFHFAMMNDTPRNEFYYELLKRNIVKGETTVLEIGAGSGVLSMMAAQLGAKWVVAVEGSDDMAALARRNIEANGFTDVVTVMSAMSTELQVSDLPSRPDVLVSEIFGTLMLGESAHEYIEDVRKRILKPGARIIPQHGVQYAVPIECPTLTSICSVSSWNGLDLRHVTAVQDTCSVVFTKKYGFRMSSVPYKCLAAPIPVVTMDFAASRAKDIPRKQGFTIEPTAAGHAHAMMLYWVVTDDGLTMSTDPADTLDNFPRDMQWGQALQLLDAGQAALPEPVMLAVGEPRGVSAVASDDGVLLQFTVKPVAAAAAAAAATVEEATADE